MAYFDYTIEDGRLVIRNGSSGMRVWQGGFEGPVVQIVALPGREGCLVLLDYSSSKAPTFENLFRVALDGSIIWKAQLPRSHDSFTEMIDRGDRVEARTWTGYLVQIDLTTGRTSDARFVK
jgi:hypothetical protein